MKNKLKYLILLLCVPFVFLAQTKNGNQTFREIKAEKDAYFEKQLKEYGKEYIEEEGSEYNEYKRWLRLWEPRIGPDGTIEDYIKKISESSGSTSNAKTSGITSLGFSDPWTELGPTDKPTSGLTNIGGGDRGIGPTQYVTFYKPNPNIMLAASLAGGLFYSNNKGATWANAGSDKWTISGCISAAFSPASSSTWYGCSDLSGNNNRHGVEANFAIASGGVWRTTDGGANYTLIGDQSDFTVWGSQTTIHKILIDPNNALIGYVATTGGLYKSSNITNPNPTWTIVRTGNIEDIEFKSDNSSVIFLTRQQTFASPTSMNQSNDWVMEFSTNSAGTWNTITPPSGGFICNTSSSSGGEPGNLELTVTEADPNLIYVEDIKDVGPSAKIYTYDYVSSSFTLRRTLSDVSFGIGRGLGVSNVSSNIVYIGHGSPGYIYKSTNFGATDAFVNPTSVSTPYHVDIEFFGCPPFCSSCSNSTDVFINTHGGVSYSSDGCTTISSRSNGLGVAEIMGFSQTDKNPEKIVMGLDHDGTILSDLASIYPALSWETVYGGDGMPPFIDKSISNNVFAAANWTGNYQFSNTGGHASTYGASSVINSCNTYGIVQNMVLPNNLYYRKNSAPNFAQIYRSNDNGVSNSDQITDFTTAYTASYVDEIDCAPSNGNYIYADVYVNNTNRIIIRTTNANAPALTVQSSWVTLASPGGPGAGMGHSAVDYLNPNIIYISMYGSRVYKCDYTNTSSPVFTDISSNLPWINFPAQLLLERGSNGGLYLANDAGVWYTNAAYLASSPSSAWQKITALPNVHISGMEINYTKNKLRVATSGRGVWEHNLLCPDLHILNLSGAYPVGFYEGDYVNVSNATFASGGTKIFRGANAVTFNPGFVAQSSGTNNYFLAFIHGCSSDGNTLRKEITDESEIVFDEKEEAEKEMENIHIYPNPHAGVFTVSFPSNEEKNISIYDITGKIIYTNKDLKEESLKIDISNFPKGLYIIKVICKDEMFSQKLIKE